MGWRELDDKDRARLLARAKRRGVEEKDLASESDLVAKRKGSIRLGRTTDQYKPKRVRIEHPADLERLLGLAESEDARLRDQRLHERRQLLPLIRPRWRRAPLPVTTVAGALVRGSLTMRDLDRSTLELLRSVLTKVEILQWLFANVVVEAGSTLEFVGPEVHTLVANKITVEPGARIVGNSAHVQIDCNTLEVQD